MTIKSVCRACIFALTLLLVSATASANVVQGSAPSLDEARALMSASQFDEALSILRPLAEVLPGQTNIHFLLALSAIEASRMATTETDREALLDEAIAVLHTLLIDRPGLVRVRLELARAFFYKREDRLSRRHFERVLAGDPPPSVANNVRQFLNEIRVRRRWSVYLGGAVTPSTNIGRVSGSDIINIYGLPFRRDADEPERSGIGFSLWTGGEYHFPLAPRLRLRLGSDAAREEYPGSQFDQTFLSGHIGPQWLVTPATTASLLADIRQRWLETSPYYLDYGARSDLINSTSHTLAVERFHKLVA